MLSCRSTVSSLIEIVAIATYGLTEPLRTGLDEAMNDDQLKEKTATIAKPLQSSIITASIVPNYDDLQHFDLLVLSPGVPLGHRLATQAMAFGIPVTSELAFAAAMLPTSVELVCVTGTNGKSTTTMFLAQMLSLIHI